MIPFEKRTPDNQYQEALKRILEEGREVLPIHGEKAKMIVGLQLRYNIENGFPLITERDLSGKFLRGALAEHIAFLNGARTKEELERFGCKWWARWVTKEKCNTFNLQEGDLGDGSYGAAWANFPTEKEGFNQIKEVLKQLKERPYLRTHFISPWIPQYTIQHSSRVRKVVVAPCHGWIHILAFPEKKELSIHHFQRSADFPVGVPFNMIQYASFGLMVAKIMDYSFKEIVYTFSDAHIYESQYDKVKELIKREAKKLPTLKINKPVEDIFKIRPEDFILEDYDPHSNMIIPTPT